MSQLEFLKKHKACAEGLDWVTKKGLLDLDDVAFAKALLKGEKHDWALWYLEHKLTKKQQIQFKQYCAKDACKNARKVLPDFERVYPNNDVPRKAIEAAEAWIKDPTEANRLAAESAASSARWSAARMAAESAAWSARWSAASAASAAESAARSAASAARSAASSARWLAASAAWSAAADAVWATGSASLDAKEKAIRKYIRYGIKVMEEQNDERRK